MEEGTSGKEHVLQGGGAGEDASGSPPPTGAVLGPVNQEEIKAALLCGSRLSPRRVKDPVTGLDTPCFPLHFSKRFH